MDATATATATSAACPPFFIHCPINGGLSARTLRTRYICLSTPPCFPISLSPFTLRSSNSYPRDRFFNGFVSRCNLTNSPEPSTFDQVAVFLEVDGVLIDAYLSGNRQAFNVAFQKLGLDCAKWTEPVYSDLFRKGDGNEERMLAIYFDRIGWPTSLPTNEKGEGIG